MSDETPSVEEIKERLKIEVEEEVAKAETVETEVADELKNLGRQFAETLQTAWNSEERQKFENDVRSGMKSFVDEIERVFQDARSSQTAERVREEAVEIKEKVETSNLGQKTRSSLAQGLHWMSEEIGKLATKFTPLEKPVDEAEDVDA